VEGHTLTIQKKGKCLVLWVLYWLSGIVLHLRVGDPVRCQLKTRNRVGLIRIYHIKPGRYIISDANKYMPFIYEEYAVIKHIDRFKVWIVLYRE